MKNFKKQTPSLRAKTQHDQQNTNIYWKNIDNIQKNDIQVFRQPYKKYNPKQLPDIDTLNPYLFDKQEPYIISCKNQSKRTQLPKLQKRMLNNNEQSDYLSYETPIKAKISQQFFSDLKQIKQFSTKQSICQYPFLNSKLINKNLGRILVRSQQKKKRQQILGPIILENKLLNRQNKYLKVRRNKIFSMSKKIEDSPIKYQQIQNITFFPGSNKKTTFVI